MSDYQRIERERAIARGYVRLLATILELDAREIDRLYDMAFGPGQNRNGSIAAEWSRTEGSTEYRDFAGAGERPLARPGHGMAGPPMVHTLPDEPASKAMLYGARKRKAKAGKRGRS